MARLVHLAPRQARLFAALALVHGLTACGTSDTTPASADTGVGAADATDAGGDVGGVGDVSGGGTDAGGGSTDGGATDAGATDAGATDAGATDAGATDAGGDASASACPQADHFLDLSKAKGAGASYPAPTLKAACEGDEVVINSNTIPSYTFVAMTPNPLKAVANTIRFPRSPKAAAATTAIPTLGRIGVAVNGLPIFGPNEGPIPTEEAWGDPIYNQIMDECLGHTANEYHYHALVQKCLTAAAVAVAEPWKLADIDTTKPSPVLGYGADGFPIYGAYECEDAACTKVVERVSGYEKTGDPKKDAWKAYTYKAGSTLDACNGHVGADGTYHYHATKAFPYVLGCFRGTATGAGTEGGGTGGPGGGGGGPGGGGTQLTACTAEADCGGTACPAEFKSGCTCQQTPDGKRCVPKCKTAADCPAVGPMQLKCLPQGFCAP